MTTRPPKVYISYSRASDAQWALGFAKRLRADGIDVIFDEWDLTPGVVIKDWQVDAVNKADAILIVVSTEYLHRYNQLLRTGHKPGIIIDLQAIQDRTRTDDVLIVPILLPNLDFSYSFPKIIDGRYGVQLSEPPEDAEEYHRLLMVLNQESKTSIREMPTRTQTRRVSEVASPVILKRLRIEHFRRIESLDFVRSNETGKSVPSHGQWTLLLGDNGTGKSSLLWGVALTLLDQEVAHGVLGNLSSPLVRTENGTASGNADCGGEVFGFRVETADRRERFVQPPMAPDFMVFAYGSARGSAFGGPERAVELDQPLASVATLFGLRSSLIHAETWLRGLEHGQLKKNGSTKQKRAAKNSNVFETVRSTLLSILPGVDRMEIDADHVRFSGAAIGDCSLPMLSDGYATTLGWVVDMMARWIHEQLRLNREIKPEFNKEMTGLVLIDELDLHLHPRWQMRVVSDLRQAFPKMSFMATTHNPLTLLGAQPGEVHILRNEADKLHVVQIDLPPGIRADQVLTGEWFGLSSTLDESTRKLLEKHRVMLRKGVSQSDPKRLKLEAELRSRLGSYADTSEDRLAQEVVAQYMSDTHATLSTHDPDAIRTKIIEALANRK